MSSKDKPIKVGVLISPGVALMDLFGAHAVFGLVPDVEFHILWKNQDLIEGSPRFPIAATTTFDECPPLDVLILGAVPPTFIMILMSSRLFHDKRSMIPIG
ncbi:hypothetical protein KFQ04_22350 [Pseudomonas synxantha]|nr:hypothetical protein KFQ04_22350 [Pseudomonas synxantha]